MQRPGRSYTTNTTTAARRALAFASLSGPPHAQKMRTTTTATPTAAHFLGMRSCGPVRCKKKKPATLAVGRPYRPLSNKR